MGCEIVDGLKPFINFDEDNYEEELEEMNRDKMGRRYKYTANLIIKQNLLYFFCHASLRNYVLANTV